MEVMLSSDPNTKEIYMWHIGSWLAGVGESLVRNFVLSVSCIRAHFSPPGNEDDFEFIGFHFADEQLYSDKFYIIFLFLVF